MARQEGECDRVGKLFGGCAFEARFDLGPSTMTGEGYMGMRLGELVEKYRQKTYVRDVCVRCGKSIERGG